MGGNVDSIHPFTTFRNVLVEYNEETILCGFKAERSGKKTKEFASVTIVSTRDHVCSFGLQSAFNHQSRTE